jgi:hypothetical protein
MLSAKTSFRLAAQFLLIFGLLIAPWPRLAQGYASFFRSIAQFGCSHLGSTALVVFQANSQPSDAILDTRVFIGNQRLLAPDGSGPAKSVELSSRQVGYLPTALIIALILATPIAGKRKIRTLLLGLLLVNCFIGATLAVIILNEYNTTSSLSLFLLPAWCQGVLRPVHELLVGYPDAHYVVVLLIWISVSFRRDDLRGARTSWHHPLLIAPSVNHDCQGRASIP